MLPQDKITNTRSDENHQVSWHNLPGALHSWRGCGSGMIKPLSDDWWWFLSVIAKNGVSNSISRDVGTLTHICVKEYWRLHAFWKRHLCLKYIVTLVLELHLHIWFFALFVAWVVCVAWVALSCVDDVEAIERNCWITVALGSVKNQKSKICCRLGT